MHMVWYADSQFCCAVADLDFISGDGLFLSMRIAIVVYVKETQQCVLIFF
jgi:hypothetical protein